MTRTIINASYWPPVQHEAYTSHDSKGWTTAWPQHQAPSSRETGTEAMSHTTTPLGWAIILKEWVDYNKDVSTPA